MRHVETIPGMEVGKDKGEWWMEWYIVRTFVNATMCSHQYNNKKRKKKHDYAEIKKEMNMWPLLLMTIVNKHMYFLTIFKILFKSQQAILAYLFHIHTVIEVHRCKLLWIRYWSSIQGRKGMWSYGSGRAKEHTVIQNSIWQLEHLLGL
jgi:hypothetical protein